MVTTRRSRPPLYVLSSPVMLLFIWSAAARLAAQESVTPPAERALDRTKTGRDRAPVLRLPVVDAAPVADGDLSDPCWAAAYHDDAFWDSDKDQSPDQKSEIWLCADAGNLYVAARLHEARPETIRCREKKRNGDVWDDDYVRLYVDPTYTQGGQYSFVVTARGTQRESIPGGSDAKIEWRGDWHAAARIVAEGWCAEMTIPWEILRYPAGQSEIGLCLSRYCPRTQRSAVWPDMGAGWDSREFAHIIGLRLPPVRRPVVLMPGVQTELGPGGFRTNIGLDAKRTFDNGLTAIATWAPDFRDIEDEVESIDFSYTERYYSDRRPFFTTGSGYMPGGNLLYSRRIDDLDFGLKLFGRVNRTNVGVMQTLTFGDREDTAVALNHSIDDNWGAAVKYVRRHVYAEPLNSAWQANGNWYRNMGAGGAWAGVSYSGSETTGGSAGYAWSVDAERWLGSDRPYYWAGYREVSPDYDPRNGYRPEVDLRQASAGVSWYASPPDAWLRRYGGNASWSYASHLDGSLYYARFAVGGSLVRAHGKDGLSLAADWTHRPPYDDHTMTANYWWGEGELHRGWSIGYTWGQVAGADYERMSAGRSWEFGDGFYGSLSYERRLSDYWDPLTEDESLSRLTMRLNYDFDEEHGCGLALRAGSAGTNVFATYRQAVSAGTDWFVVLGNPNTDETEARVAVKTKWVWK